MIRVLKYALDSAGSTSLDLVGPRTRTLAEREYKNVLNKPFRDELYKAVVSDDVAKVNEVLSSGEDMALGAMENRGFTKLILGTAIENDNDEILEVLISNKAMIGGILFTAVREGSYKCIKCLVKILEEKTPEEGDLGPMDCKTEGFYTPLMMAIQMNEYNIVEYLITQGYSVKSDPEYVYEDNAEMNDLGIDLPKITRFMGFNVKKRIHKNLFPKEYSILLKINTFKALANPMYISFMYIHDKSTLNPLYQIFKLSREMRFRASIDQEFKEDYNELRHQCQDFAVDLMEQCRTLREVKILTDIAPEFEKRQRHIEIKKETAKELEFINLAIKGNNDKLVAHPYSQLCLNMVLYKDIYTIFSFETNWRDRGSFSVFLYTFRHILLLPFLALIHIIAPGSKVSRILGNPLIKFMSHFWSMLVFVGILLASSFQDKIYKEICTPGIPDLLIMVWILGLIVQEFKELSIQGRRRYFTQWWNTVTFLMVLLFTISYVLSLVAYSIAGRWMVFDPVEHPTTFKVILLSNSLFSIGMVLSFLRISAVFQANDKLGPLQLSLYYLILDVMKFMVFFALIIVAFGFSLIKLYSHYISMQKYIAAQKIAKNSGGDSKNLDTSHRFSQVHSGLHGLFWSLFGLTELNSFSTEGDNFAITNGTGEFLFGFFQVLGVIVAINMLIAMMTKSFDDIANNAIKKWKVSRSRLWMFWVEKGSILPPPLNLFPNTRFIFKQLKKIYYRCCKKDHASSSYHSNQGFSDIQENPQSVEDLSGERRHRKIKDILKRYIRMRKSRDNFESETQNNKACRSKEKSKCKEKEAKDSSEPAEITSVAAGRKKNQKAKYKRLKNRASLEYP